MKANRDYDEITNWARAEKARLTRNTDRAGYLFGFVFLAIVMPLVCAALGD